MQIEIHLRYIDDIWRYGHIWPMIKGVLRCFASLQPYCGRGLKFLNTLHTHTHIPVCSKHVYTPFCNWCLFFSAWKDKSTPMFMAEVRLFIVFFGGLASGIHNYPYEFPPFNQLQDLLIVFFGGLASDAAALGVPFRWPLFWWRAASFWRVHVFHRPGCLEWFGSCNGFQSAFVTWCSHS